MDSFVRNIVVGCDVFALSSLSRRACVQGRRLGKKWGRGATFFLGNHDGGFLSINNIFGTINIFETVSPSPRPPIKNCLQNFIMDTFLYCRTYFALPPFIPSFPPSQYVWGLSCPVASMRLSHCVCVTLHSHALLYMLLGAMCQISAIIA